MVTQNLAKIANLIVEGNWFDNGQNSVCVSWASTRISR